MLIIFISIVAAAIVGVILLKYGSECYDFINFVAAIFGMIILVSSGISLVCYSFLLREWMASEHKANIINREYGTKYTQQEVFYASDVIDTIRQLDRKRFEINGNIIGNK